MSVKTQSHILTPNFRQLDFLIAYGGREVPQERCLILLIFNDHLHWLLVVSEWVTGQPVPFLHGYSEMRGMPCTMSWRQMDWWWKISAAVFSFKSGAIPFKHEERVYCTISLLVYMVQFSAFPSLCHGNMQEDFMINWSIFYSLPFIRTSLFLNCPF